jgi:hypothetical protein
MKSPMLLLTFFASISTVTAQSLCDEETSQAQVVFETNCAEEIKCQDACFNEVNAMLTQSNIQQFVNVCEMTPGDLRSYLNRIQGFNSAQIEKCGRGLDGLQSIKFDDIKFEGSANAPAPSPDSGKSSSIGNFAYLWSLLALIGISVA